MGDINYEINNGIVTPQLQMAGLQGPRSGGASSAAPILHRKPANVAARALQNPSGGGAGGWEARGPAAAALGWAASDIKLALGFGVVPSNCSAGGFPSA